MRDESQAAPFEVRAKFKYFGHGAQRSAIPFPGNDALVLVFDFGLAVAQLAQQHHDGLQNVQRLEAGDDDRFAFVLGNPIVGPAADDRGNVAGADKAVEAHVRRIQNRADGGNDGDVIAEHGEILQAFGFRAHQG